jgi:hypothetical protein
LLACTILLFGDRALHASASEDYTSIKADMDYVRMTVQKIVVESRIQYTSNSPIEMALLEGSATPKWPEMACALRWHRTRFQKYTPFPS